MDPIHVSGKVVKGFGRGSKELGIPTANFPSKVVDDLPADVATGIYYGWAQVEAGPVRKMVLSVGWNPYYQNTKKSMETHIMHKFEQDFYGSELRVLICGYIRPEKNFSSLDELIGAINADIKHADRALEDEKLQKLKNDEFFLEVDVDQVNSANSV